jgi:hypothetical protein
VVRRHFQPWNVNKLRDLSLSCCGFSANRHQIFLHMRSSRRCHWPQPPYLFTYEVLFNILSLLRVPTWQPYYCRWKWESLRLRQKLGLHGKRCPIMQNYVSFLILSSHIYFKKYVFTNFEFLEFVTWNFSVSFITEIHAKLELTTPCSTQCRHNRRMLPYNHNVSLTFLVNFKLSNLNKEIKHSLWMIS